MVLQENAFVLRRYTLKQGEDIKATTNSQRLLGSIGRKKNKANVLDK